MTETISYIINSLKDYYPPNEIRGFTQLIMEQICGLQPYQLLLGKDNDLSDKEKTEIAEIVERLKKSEPIQYILGTANFYGYDFTVNPSVLIPRPETAELVNKIIEDSRNSPISPLRILDIGTGSGCIAISLAKHLNNAEVFAMDISADALSIAKLNAEKLNADIQFIQADILSATKFHSFREKFEFLPRENKISSEREVNIIVSNPPYITEKEKTDMEANVLNYEPHSALFVPDNDPLLFYRTIARFGKQNLSKNGYLYFEINSQFGTETKEMLKQEGYRHIELIQDFYKKDRIIKAQI
ncbi:peptide chain release factor N(5)-glutamine methyltransferase [Parabacteroides bouchesdurhonensis]|uniref:peptide chain release factor N(5)-glutamine methyltransferase n=1 Tax=Parabacteroides bouchesdurhonensis TaxID=1936995 RepID=UPI000E4E2DBE|nr:peptide chain release factor N(5)-glutamine methyltransferase [Parabacteroides bouchesdurhonensis]RHJ93400.1 peptide chain release factor N(5)-glutamine methyltransferase [Bacteroides sp. AM07-16]